MTHLGSRMRSPVLRDVPDVGECIISILGDGRIRIDRADPRTLIHADLLDDVRAGRCSPHVRAEGDLLYIDGVNQSVVYRIGDRRLDRYAYLLEWPD